MKRLSSIAVAIGAAAVVASILAVALDKTLPYRIGPDDYSKYLWIERLTVASLGLGLLALVSGSVTRKVLPVILGMVGLSPLLLVGGVHSGPNPEAWCYNNLRQIEGAKDELARERGLSNSPAITLLDISRFLPARPELRCAKGGAYIINPIGKDARCTFHGSIAEMEAQWQRNMQAQPGGSGNPSKPTGLETNRTSGAAGPGG